MTEERPLLEGIRVVELGAGMAGAAATLLLAEVGADVVKVEPPGGDSTRGGVGSATWNRSKRSVVLDLADAADVDRLHGLLGGADVLVHGLRPADAAAAGVAPADLDRFDRLVVCGLTPWPARHPLAERDGDDTVITARLGLCDEQAGAREGPLYLRFPFASWGAAHLAAIGILARLRVRDRTGAGGRASTSLAEGALSLATLVWSRARQGVDAYMATMAKHQPATVFECADGRWVHASPPPPDTLPLLAELLAELGLPDDMPPTERQRRVFALRDSETWLQHLQAHDVSCGRAETLGEILRDEQAALNGYVVSVDDPELGPTRQAGAGIHVTPRPTVRGPAPRVGAHTEEVLHEPARDPGGAIGPEPAPPGRWPLEGVRVVDFGQYIAGPFAAMVLADLGAEVVKVEPPMGDAVRRVERAFVGCQRGKRGLAIDLRKPEARPVVEALATWADVAHSNARLPAARRLGIDPDAMQAINPALVYCHVSAYGPAGPRADWPGVDAIFQATCGWEVEGAGEGNPPRWYRFGMLDQLSGMQSVIAVLLGLRDRDRTGRGQQVAASLLGAGALTVSETLLLPDGTVAPYARLDHDLAGVGPNRSLHRTVDGWLAVSVAESAVDALVSAVGARDAKGIADAAAGWRTADLVDALDGAGLMAEPALQEQLEPFFDDPVNRSIGFTTSRPHPAYGELEQIGRLWDFGDLDVRLDRPAPLLGQHTDEILAELGFTTADVGRLHDAGVVTGGGL